GNRTNIVTGPKILKRRVKNNIEEIFEYEQISPTFEDLSSAVQGIMNDFCCIKELDDIEGLETDNPIHRECVGKHSQTVAYLVQQENSFKKFKKVAQDILVFSAYLHDIGKGPKSRWPDGIQKVDDDHPRKSLPMLKRILTEDIGNLSKKEIRRIHMLVVYDDLVGDIVANGRDKNQFFQIVKNTIDVDLLISLGTADMKAINPEWVTKHNEAIEALRQEAYDYLGK
ncbi:HD domain-containing protein, partial [Vibrio cyclitrophicus]